MIGGGEERTLVHVFREQNAVADWLAQRADVGAEERIVLTKPPFGMKVWQSFKPIASNEIKFLKSGEVSQGFRWDTNELVLAKIQNLSEKDDGGSWIAVSSQYSSAKPSICPKSSGNLPKLEQPERMRVCRPFNLQMLFGRLTRCLQKPRSINLRFVSHSIDDGSSLTAVASACTSNKQAMGAAIFGKFSSFKQPDRIIVSSFSK
nr:uncharacterized protein LOC109148758 [Ipomoea trifida]